MLAATALELSTPGPAVEAFMSPSSSEIPTSLFKLRSKFQSLLVVPEVDFETLASRPLILLMAL